MTENRTWPPGAIQTHAGEAERCHQSPNQPMPPTQAKIVVEQRAREQPEHHDIAGRQCDQRRMPGRHQRRHADRIAHRMRGRAEREGCAEASRQHVAEVREQRCRQHQQQRHGAGAKGKFEIGKQHPVDPIAHARA
ncbi:hypothetical protein ACVIU4_010626 [Bradyrhizobium barranii subsp. barranii]